MSWEYSEEFYKEYTRETWNASVEAYEAWVQALAPFNEPLLESLDPQPGERILDVASGRGEPAFSLAEAAGVEGQVLGIDLADEMIAQAQRGAKERGLDNLRFQVMDAEEMTLEDASFDAVSCRSSLQIMTAPEAALAEIARVLKPGGRFAASVWSDPGERSPALHAIMGTMLMYFTPDETGYLPTPYELGGPGTLAEMVEAAGLKVVGEQRVVVPLRFEDEEAYFRAMLQGTPVGHSLKEEAEEVQQKVMEETRQNLARWNKAADGLELDSEAVLVHAV
ncbi:MAG: methyltransferase domain-containing protein, partial [Candidatus Thermoplasmatota archaeon]|nr:methyltransferase domain-containing protein [Candidatus Thermoplasmatota archaeon]